LRTSMDQGDMPEPTAVGVEVSTTTALQVELLMHASEAERVIS